MTPNTSGFGAAISAAAKGSQWEIALSLLKDLGFVVLIILDAMNQKVGAT